MFPALRRLDERTVLHPDDGALWRIALGSVAATIFWMAVLAQSVVPPKRGIDPIIVVGAAPAGPGDVTDVVGAVGASVVHISGEDRSGSGFFFAPGRVLTNAHVIAGGTVTTPLRVTVVLADGRERPGEVNLIDEFLDIAVVEVTGADHVAPLAFAGADELEAGQQVVAFGSPLGLARTVTTGVLSSVARNSTYRTNAVQTNLLQTDAAVNPGSSGGPLVDMAGRVVGVITIRPDDDGGRPIAGVALALRSDAVLRSLDKLARDGVARYAVAGIVGRSATGDDRVTSGAFVTGVAGDGPASAAGLRAGDVIVAADGTKVSSFEQLMDLVAGASPGDVVELGVERSGRMRTLRVRLTARDVAPTPAPAPEP